MLASSLIDHGFKLLSGQTKDYKIDIFCLSAKLAELRSKSRNWLAQKKDLFQCAGTIKI